MNTRGLSNGKTEASLSFGTRSCWCLASGAAPAVKRILPAIVAWLGLAWPSQADVVLKRTIILDSDTPAFERSNANIGFLAGENWYLVAHIGQDLSDGIDHCNNAERPCILMWDLAQTRWEEAHQPAVPSGVCSTGCQWLVDAEARAGYAAIALHERTSKQTWLLWYQLGSSGPLFATEKWVRVVNDDTTGNMDASFAAVAVDDNACGYVLSNVNTGSRIMRMHTVALTDPTPTEAEVLKRDLQLNLADDAPQRDDGGDVARIDSTKVVAVWSNQNSYKYYSASRTQSTSSCATPGWSTADAEHEAALATVMDSERVDGHISLGKANGEWFAVVKTSAPGSGAGADNPIMMVFADDSGSTDVFELMDRDRPAGIEFPIDGMSRPTAWYEPEGFTGSLMVAFQDDTDPRNTVVMRVESVSEVKAGDGNPSTTTIVEWETRPQYLTISHPWPRAVFTGCDKLGCGNDPNDLPNYQKHGDWRGASFLSRQGAAGYSVFLASKDGTTLITAAVDWLSDIGCRDHYDGDARQGIDTLDASCLANADPFHAEDTQCDDTFDNDLDTKVDLVDNNCLDARDDKEYPTGGGSCGLGFEVILPLVALGLTRQRRASKAPCRRSL